MDVFNTFYILKKQAEIKLGIHNDGYILIRRGAYVIMLDNKLKEITVYSDSYKPILIDPLKIGVDKNDRFEYFENTPTDDDIKLFYFGIAMNVLPDVPVNDRLIVIVTSELLRKYGDVPESGLITLKCENFEVFYCIESGSIRFKVSNRFFLPMKYSEIYKMDTKQIIDKIRNSSCDVEYLETC